MGERPQGWRRAVWQSKLRYPFKSPPLWFHSRALGATPRSGRHWQIIRELRASVIMSSVLRPCRNPPMYVGPAALNKYCCWCAGANITVT
jgi:hypothetical protein